MGKSIDNYSFFSNIGNLLYKICFPLYKFLFFIYKNKSDRDKIIFLKSKIKPGMIVIDIGANIGFYTLLFSKLVGKNGKVYAFEPDELNFKNLKRNTKKINNIVINKYAVGEKDQKIKLYHSDYLNVDHHTYDNGGQRNFSEIDCISIDSFFKEHEKIDLVKIDIQGYDYYALKGMQETVEKSSNIMIYGEFWPYGLKKAGADGNKYINLLKELKFSLKLFNCDEDYDFSEKDNDKYFYIEYFGNKRK